jgi:hypothetical protein
MGKTVKRSSGAAVVQALRAYLMLKGDVLQKSDWPVEKPDFFRYNRRLWRKAMTM